MNGLPRHELGLQHNNSYGSENSGNFFGGKKKKSIMKDMSVKEDNCFLRAKNGSIIILWLFGPPPPP